MTPQQKLKHMILQQYTDWIGEPLPEVTAENVDALYQKAKDNDDSFCDAVNEVRCSGEDTHLPHPFSRHYEAKSVAAQAPDGSWVGWTYWYGGGKHGYPQGVDWIPDAYDLTVTEKEVTITQRTFSLVVGPDTATA